MNTIIISQKPATSDPIAQVRANIQTAQRLVLASEGRTLDFETADEISRELLTSIKELTPISIITPDEEFDEFTDEELIELEMRLSRDHSDDAYWI
jgi:hypothetical protein